MNKELLEHLTQAHVDEIKEWLAGDEIDKVTFCPFLGMPYYIDSCNICRIMFGLGDIHYCPCNEFPMSHVVKVAKQTIKEWEIKQVINRL
jgi:hypothetical protein